MKTRREMKVGRDAIRQEWKLAGRISVLSQDIRYANKPSDLQYPIHELIQITRRLQVFREQWLGKWLDCRGERLKGWPRLWERYL